MDRRHLKILDEFRSIVEEKETIMQYLEKITSQLSIYIDRIQKQTLSRNDTSKLLSIELDVFITLIDMSRRLETILETKIIVDQAEEPVTTEVIAPPVAIPLASEDHPEPSIDPTFESIHEELGIDEMISSFQRFFQKAGCSTEATTDLFLLPERDCNNGNSSVEDPYSIRKDLQLETDDGETETNDSYETASSAFGPSTSQSNETVTLGTAIAKLNNQSVSTDRCDVLPLELPDVRLKPTTDILNTFIVNNLTSERKKHRKKVNVKMPNNNIGEDTYCYEILNSKFPKLDQMCSFSFIESPWNFYIHLVDEETCYIDMISERLTQVYRDTHVQYSTKKQASKGIKKFCVMFMDSSESWYRGEVLDWRLDIKDDQVSIRLVDFGHTHLVSFQCLRKLTKNFASTPALAIRCHFPLLYPPNSNRVNRMSEWPDSSIAALGDLGGLRSHQHKFFSLSYVDYSPERQSFGIDVFCEDYNETLGQSLLDLGYAVQIEQYEDPEQYELEEFLQDVDDLERANNINEAVIGYDPRDEARICRFTKRDGTCFKGKHCKLEHVPISKDGFTMDKDIVFQEAMETLLLPAPGSFVFLLITCYIDPCHFFAQIINRPKRERSYDMDEALFDLHQTINIPKLLSSYDRLSVAPSIGEVVIVRHWIKKWLRGIVRDFNTDDEGNLTNIEVYLVDYGDNITVKLDDLRKIKPDYLRLPFQAVECYIDNYKMKADCCKNAAEVFFNRNLLFRNFVAITRSTNLPLKVTLKTPDQSLEIGKSLEENGFAERRIIDYYIDDNCVLVPG